MGREFADELEYGVLGVSLGGVLVDKEHAVINFLYPSSTMIVYDFMIYDSLTSSQDFSRLRPFNCTNKPADRF